jgi:hypothetical protein
MDISEIGYRLQAKHERIPALARPARADHILNIRANLQAIERTVRISGRASSIAIQAHRWRSLPRQPEAVKPRLERYKAKDDKGQFHQLRFRRIVARVAFRSFVGAPPNEAAIVRLSSQPSHHPNESSLAIQ